MILLIAAIIISIMAMAFLVLAGGNKFDEEDKRDV